MDYVIGLGSNLGSREQNLVSARALLESADLSVIATSLVYDSAPLGPPQPRYLNGAVRVTTSLLPAALLERLLAIEVRLGRVRRERWGPRTIDLDILWAPCAMQSERLTIPHPALCERAFALAPLLDVAPELQASYAAALAAVGGAPVHARMPEEWFAKLRGVS